MEKVILGRSILFREKCPECGEWNISGTSSFECEECGTEYKEIFIKSTRVEVPPHYKRKVFTKELRNKKFFDQNGKCFWCGRKFYSWVRKNSRIIQIKMHVDHLKPFSYFPDDTDDNLVAACSICNIFKSNKMFEDVEECKQYLLYKWDSYIKSGKIEVL